MNEMIDEKSDYFPAHFRVSRHVFEVLLRYVRPKIRSKYVGGHLPLPVDKQLLVFLCYINSNWESAVNEGGVTTFWDITVYSSFCCNESA